MRRSDIETLSGRQYRALVTAIETLGERVCDVMASATFGVTLDGADVVVAPIHGAVLTCDEAGEVVVA